MTASDTATIAPGVQAGTVVLVGAWAVVTQQALAAVFYASLNAFTSAGKPRFFGDYVQEYILWRLRLPTHALSTGQKIANVAAATVVLVIIFAAWRWLS